MDSQNALHLAKMQNSSRETRDYAFKMEAVKKNLMPPVDKEKKLRESCEGFESIFIQKMWEQMRASIPESGFLKGREEKFWQGMYDQELAKSMASAGGIGLADMMYDQLSRSLRTASKDTADTLGGRPSGFAADIAPAPLVRAQASQAKTPEENAQAPDTQQARPAPAVLYSEAKQPDAPGAFDEAHTHPRAAPVQTAPHLASAPAHPATDDGTDPAIIAVLNELRAAHQAASSANGQQTPRDPSLGARPPLPPLQDGGHSQEPGQQAKAAYISTLTKPVHKPVSGKRTVLPRAMSGPRVPMDQPVNRNLSFAEPEIPAADRSKAGG